MPYIGLNATQQAGRAIIRPCANCFGQRIHFNWVTENCTGAVRFDVNDIVYIDA